MSLLKYLTNIFSRSPVVNSASAIGHEFDTTNTLSTTGANLLRLSNNATPVFDFSYQGGIDHVNSGASTAAHSQSLNLNWISTSTRTSNGLYSAVIGHSNTASGTLSFAQGELNQSLSSYSFCAGNQNQSTHTSAASFGTQAVSRYSSCLTLADASFAAAGDAQVSIVVQRASTTDATQTTMVSWDSGGTIPADTTWFFSAHVVGRSNEADGNDSAAYKVEGVITRDESNNTALVGAVTVTTIAESAGAAAWDVTATANDTTEKLDIQVTGDASTTIRWVASIRITQVTLA